jgi:hypothetical protein
MKGQSLEEGWEKERYSLSVDSEVVLQMIKFR